MQRGEFQHIYCMHCVAQVNGWQDAHPPDVVIRPGFPLGDAVVPVEGYDVEICPVSAVLQAVVFWALSCSISDAEASGGSHRL